MKIQIFTAESYLHDVHERWEKYGGQIWEGAAVATLQELQLVRLIGHKSEAYSEFDYRLSAPLDKITEILHRELFGTSPLEADAAGSKARAV